MSDVTIRWGIIGCGNVAETKSGPPLYRAPGSELVAVMRRDGAKARDFAERHGARRWYTDAAALVADPDINAVYIASPHDRHLEHATLAAQAGKMILCEKPMGTSVEQARAIVQVCQANHVPLTVAYYRRFWPITRAVKRLLAEGAIGRLVSVRVQLADYFAGDPARPWLTSPAASGGGALANAGSHWVDLVRFYLGEIAQVMAMQSSKVSGFETEDTVALLMRTNDDVLVTFLVTLQSPVSTNEIDFLGTEGRILCSPYSEGHWLVYRRNRNPDLIQFPNSGPAHTELVAELIPRLQAGQPSPVPGEEAVAVWQIMDACYRSAAEGKRVAVASAAPGNGPILDKGKP